MDDGKEETQDNSRRKRSHKRKRVLIPIFIVILGCALATAYWYLHLRGYVSTNNAYIDGDEVTVSSKVLGRVTGLMVDEGDTTAVGQLLVQLDDSVLRAQEEQSEAAIEYAEENVSLAKTGLDRAQDDFRRASVQHEDKVITSEQYDHARLALETAKAQCRVALSQVNASKAQLGVVQAQLEALRIEAPMSGVVARKWVLPGDIVQPGQPIFTIYDLKGVWITANLEETKLASVDVGDSVRITVDTYPDREFTGRILLIGAAAASQFSLIPPNNASGNFTKVTQRVPVKISIDDTGSGEHSSDVLLLPGMSVEVKIRVGAK